MQITMHARRLAFVSAPFLRKDLGMEWTFNAQENIDRCLAQRGKAGGCLEEWPRRRV